MDVSNLAYPDGYTEPSEPQVTLFNRLIWHNGEVCNNCFQQIREIGDEVEVTTTLFTHKLNTSYNRTEHGSQEHDPFQVASDRYGQCYCLDCGSDTKAEASDLSIEAMQRRSLNLLDYINRKTEHWADGKAMGESIRELKAVHDNGGYDSEIFCVATIRAIQAAPTPPMTSAPTPTAD